MYDYLFFEARSREMLQELRAEAAQARLTQLRTQPERTSRAAHARVMLAFLNARRLIPQAPDRYHA